MSKRVGFTALHYGKPYLAWAIRSIIDSIDEYVVVYSDVGSHGHQTQLPCPDTRDELYAIASEAAGAKLRWHEGRFPYEGAQREMIHQLAPDADVIIVCDSDEIYPDGLVDELIEQTSAMHRRTIRVPFVHFWRSFHRCVLHDPAFPVRVIYPHVQSGEETAHTRPIAHMGYAIPPELCFYKLHTHGHRNELRRDWFDNVFMANRQTDCHPVGSDHWWPETVNPLDYLPAFMQSHPYYGMDVIE